ncbi:hypothetical protein [Modestobacter altitudinis]|uniref:hypothetical protein n=1 Tax=Modestobacter altitudinis TaxID=2213158 RepID=UPI00110CB31C|nr:hypothetical protein [Modestobacter altitudinis]
MRALIRCTNARLTAVARRALGDDPERGDVQGWAALGGLAAVSTVVMVAKYQELLVQAMSKVADATLGGPPGV